ncbi:hypothetical protein D3C76_895360 [compost metagenome]
MHNRRESNKNRRLLTRFLKKLRTRIFGDRLFSHLTISLEIPMRSSTSSMYNPFRNPFAIKVGYFLNEIVIL